MDIFCKNTITYLPTTVSASRVAITDLYLPNLCNFPGGRVQVNAKGKTHAFHIDPCYCPTIKDLAAALRKALGNFSKFTATTSIWLKVETIGDARITFSQKLAKVLRLANPFSGKVTVALPDLREPQHLKRIYVTSSLVSPSLVGSSCLPILYYGPPNVQLQTPHFLPLTTSNLNTIDFIILDGDLDPMVGEATVALRLSP